MKIRMLIAPIALAVTLSACHNDSRLKDELSSMTFPQEFAPQFTLDSVWDDGHNVTYLYSYADSLYNPARDIEKTGYDRARDMSLGTLIQNPDSRPFVEAVNEAGRGLSYIYVGTQSQDTCRIDIPSDRISNALKAFHKAKSQSSEK